MFSFRLKLAQAERNLIQFEVGVEFDSESNSAQIGFFKGLGR